MRIAIIIGAAALLAGCGGEPAEKPAEPEAPKEVVGGEYEVTSTVTAFRATDKSGQQPAIKVGDTATNKVCAKPGKKPDPALFAAKGDSCKDMSSFVSAGRLSMQLNCTRPGKGGWVGMTADGSFTADGFEAQGNVTTAFTGEGDYVAEMKYSGKRLGDCAAG